MLNFICNMKVSRLRKSNNINYRSMHKAKIPQKIIRSVLLQETIKEIRNDIL